MLRFKAKNYFFLGFVLALIIIFHYLGWLNFLERGARSIIVPISSKITHWRLSSQDSYDYFSNKEEVVSNYTKCLEKNQNFEVADAKLKNLEQENIELKKQLNFLRSHNFKNVTAEVVGRNTDSVEKMIIISAGETSGIKLNQPVVVGDGILVGTIAKVEKNISMVRLINDNQSKIAATLLNKDGSLGVVEGGYGLSIKMNFIPRNETVLIGDQIITSGMEQTIPRGLLIGEVAIAENEAYQPFQQAVLTASTDLSKLFIVSVLVSN
ncbi:MAG: rod shape-determining protein MreC [Candidatus Magasanikbacteria bacterium RIFOXYD2_FULL_39_9]|uniref:Cell shape-determining protein MreC n=1 Tax=Candidatus Magasanikbacteria bacterium RIFOXYD1_FULL_40_23 TaxID=1798705 RepID=A0A1F6PB76_9BACT|nr:MAG: rod shape-determining protein MreC [Candidatus Magasanikbacteria bacterium RIFOXYD2_FULL_39_9]OGH93300.1 MAG: rod shape-determining protein MreC [Candidatus Magasanikbacteria bacterium RIFOXYD1_FULL_40_23]